ncbi:MAG: prolyl oligopeptidase family serine peptidase [Pirellulales bacterium]|nr:prolyl oligopeptidase family serine peptidase [Pirellulales bacterium]
MCKRLLACYLCVCCTFLLTTPLGAQGSREDYQRADALRGKTRNKVFRTNIRPHWLGETNSFWYRVQVAPGRHEFVLVDSDKGERRAAFDHTALAEALSHATGKKLEATRLPFWSIRFDETISAVRFFAAGQSWQWHLEKNRLEKMGAANGEESTVLILQSPRRSQHSILETSIRFVNRTKNVARLFWVDTTGNQSSYGMVKPGAERDQHTFSGHVWVVKDGNDGRLAVFQATEDPGLAIIDHSTPAERNGQAKQDTFSPRGHAKSPDGKWQARIQEHNVVLRNLEDNKEIPLSDDGSSDDPYVRRFRWSPDSSKLLVIQERPGENRQIRMIESSPQDQLQPKLHTHGYAKPGDRLPLPRPRLFDISERRQIPVAEELFPNPWNISQLRWSPDSNRFTFLYNQRGHQTLRIVGVDAQTGAARAVVDETAETFICYSSKQFSHYLDDTQEIVWMSERDGWNHLYLYDAQTGEVKNQITSGEWVVRAVDRVDEKARQIWFQAGGVYPDQDPYYRHLCRVNLDGSGFTVLTQGDGTHRVEYSPNREYFVDTYSRVDMPPVTQLRRSSDGSLVCQLEQGDFSRLLETGWNPPERFVAKGRDGKTDIYGVIHRPTNFERGKKYPVIEKIYAGPHGAFVPKQFSAFHDAQAMAELGFVVVQIDGMGTSHRSKQFHDVCWQNLGDSGFPDRILWMQAAAKKYPEMDLQRIGIYGGSAGGQSALRALLAHGDFYDVAVADCGCHDNRMDKIWWNEQWMGWPVGPHYQQQSNVTQAHRLEGKLLLIVGELDRNVDPASTMQVVNALVQADKDFDLLVVPGVGHGAGSRPYGVRRTRDFFVRRLLGVEPRAL